ncbi:conserved hypothetical protein [Roseibium sp. TrichSKD4]|uniref:phage tail tube protein n=1 Tax=Roseibium sp. TrichSKD4 TaxID=744980 RepID=UPI0001E56B8D|nr:phage tail tube protein [Roseibium sp. TrichSKD4]EFO32618.1 conserved hypothetical protein [Roseibium sp. TrichSKD4]
MAQSTTLRFGKFDVMLGVENEGAITYTAPCGFLSKALNLSKSLSEVLIPDCDDPDAPIAVGRDVESISWSVSGEGVLAEESVETWLDAFGGVTSVPVKVVQKFPGKTITFTGNAHLESLETAVERGGRATANVSIQGDGPITWAIV